MFILIVFMSLIPAMLGLIIFSVWGKSKISRSLFIFMFILCLWILDNSILYSGDYLSDSQRMAFFKILRVGPFATCTSLFFLLRNMTSEIVYPMNGIDHKIYTYLRNDISKNIQIILVVVCYLINLTDLSVTGFVPVYSGEVTHLTPTYGVLGWIIVIPIVNGLIHNIIGIILSFRVIIKRLRFFMIVLNFSFTSILLFGSLNISKYFSHLSALSGILFFCVTITLSFIKYNLDNKTAEKEKLNYESQINLMGDTSIALVHEMNNIISVLKSVELIPKLVKVEGDAAELLSVINMSVNQLDSLIKQFSNFKAVSSLDFEIIDIEKTILECRELTKNIDKNSTLVFNNKMRNNSLLGDEVKIKQVFINLFKNAIESMNGCRKKDMFVELVDDNDNVNIYLTDSGCGIPESRWETIFEPFKTNKVGGSGIGLPLSRNIIEFHGGKLEIHKSNTLGTTFLIVLPRKL